jgi:hypothetical protein
MSENAGNGFNWGGGAVASGTAIVPQINQQTYGLAGQTAGIGATPFQVWKNMTTIEAANRYIAQLGNNSAEAQLITNTLISTGAASAGASPAQLVSAYKTALDWSAAAIAGGNLNFDVLKAMQQIGGQNAGGGGQGGTYKDFAGYTDEQLSQKAIESYTGILGRTPTVEEKKAFAKALKAGAAAAPSTTKRSASGKITTSTKGFDENAFIAGYMSNQIPDQGSEIDGLAGSVQDMIDKYKEAYGIDPSSSFKYNAVRDVVGSTDRQGALSNLEQQLKEQAQVLYPSLKEKIDAGMTVRSIADPYISSYSRLMETDAMNIRLDNKYIQGALSARNDKGEYVMPSQDEFARSIRSTEEWLNTKNAKETMLSAADSVLKSFGFRR